MLRVAISDMTITSSRWITFIRLHVIHDLSLINRLMNYWWCIWIHSNAIAKSSTVPKFYWIIETVDKFKNQSLRILSKIFLSNIWKPQKKYFRKCNDLYLQFQSWFPSFSLHYQSIMLFGRSEILYIGLTFQYLTAKRKLARLTIVNY